MIGEVKLADVLVAPSPDAENEVFRLADGSPAAGRWAADREMKVSTHFAGTDAEMSAKSPHTSYGFSKLTDDSLLVFAAVVKLEQLASAQGEDHTLIIFLEMIIYLRGDQSRQFSFGKGFIFVKGLAGWMSAMSIDSKTLGGWVALVTGVNAMGNLCKQEIVGTYISGTAFTTSVQSRSICESNDFKAKTLSSGSGSDRKPTRPPAETSPTIAIEDGV